MSDIKKKLEKLQGDWEESEAAEGGRKRFKDGDFTVKLKAMEVGESKSSGRTQLVTTFEVIEPEKHEGEEIRMFNGIDDKGMPYLKLLCNQFGIEMPDDLVDLPDTVSEFAEGFEGTIELALVTKDGYQNTYVNEVNDGISTDKPKKNKTDDDGDDDDGDGDGDDGDDDDDDDKPVKKGKKKIKKQDKKKIGK